MIVAQPRLSVSSKASSKQNSLPPGEISNDELIELIVFIAGEKSKRRVLIQLNWNISRLCIVSSGILGVAFESDQLKAKTK